MSIKTCKHILVVSLNKEENKQIDFKDVSCYTYSFLPVVLLVTKIAADLIDDG